MTIYQHATEPIERIPELDSPPEFFTPWEFKQTSNGPWGLTGYWWRICTGGDIYRVMVDTYEGSTSHGALSRF